MKQYYLKLSFFLLLSTFFTTIAHTQGSLYVHPVEGNQQSFRLSDIDKITFPGEKMLITFKKSSLKHFPIPEIQYYNFKYIHEWEPGTNPTYVIRIFPNPTDNKFSIESSVEINKIILYDLVGRQLMQVLPNSDIINLELDNFSRGVYVLQIMTAEGILSEKIIKD